MAPLCGCASGVVNFPILGMPVHRTVVQSQARLRKLPLHCKPLVHEFVTLGNIRKAVGCSTSVRFKIWHGLCCRMAC